MKKYWNLSIVSILLFIVIPGAAQPSITNPEENFEHFWNLFNKSYASFEEKNIDWKTEYEKYRPAVDAETTDEDLFGIFEKMLIPLNDSHVGLSSKRLDRQMKGNVQSKINSELEPLPSKRRRVVAMTTATLMELEFEPIKEIGPKFRGNKLFAYTNNGKVGYLRFFRSFSKLYWMKGLSLNSQLNKIFQSFDGLDAVIIDVRFNMGGTDEFSFNVIGHLIEEEILSHYKQTKVDVDQWTALKSIKIKPTGRYKYLNDVYLLTNDRTVSAADVLALGMSTLPNVTIVGDRTNGSLSDIYSKKLPNGFSVQLSNQRYLSIDKINYEGEGVPVDIEAHTTLQDVEQKDDSVLRKVLMLINEK